MVTPKLFNRWRYPSVGENLRMGGMCSNLSNSSLKGREHTRYTCGMLFESTRHYTLHNNWVNGQFPAFMMRKMCTLDLQFPAELRQADIYLTAMQKTFCFLHCKGKKYNALLPWNPSVSILVVLHYNKISSVTT